MERADLYWQLATDVAIVQPAARGVGHPVTVQLVLGRVSSTAPIESTVPVLVTVKVNVVPVESPREENPGLTEADAA